MSPGAKTPRLSEFTVALCVALRDGGMSYRDIAKHRLVKKRDGTHPTYQAVMKAVKVRATARKSARWRMSGAGKMHHSENCARHSCLRHESVT